MRLNVVRTEVIKARPPRQNERSANHYERLSSVIQFGAQAIMLSLTSTELAWAILSNSQVSSVLLSFWLLMGNTPWHRLTQIKSTDPSPRASLEQVDNLTVRISFFKASDGEKTPNAAFADAKGNIYLPEGSQLFADDPLLNHEKAHLLKCGEIAAREVQYATLIRAFFKKALGQVNKLVIVDSLIGIIFPTFWRNLVAFSYAQLFHKNVYSRGIARSV